MDWNRPLVAGLTLTALSLTGYAIGVLEPYPGRALTLAGVMVGIALTSVGGGRALASARASPDPNGGPR